MLSAQTLPVHLRLGAVGLLVASTVYQKLGELTGWQQLQHFFLLQDPSHFAFPSDTFQAVSPGTCPLTPAAYTSAEQHCAGQETN